MAEVIGEVQDNTNSASSASSISVIVFACRH
jgi:hypothetical protein